MTFDLKLYRKTWQKLDRSRTISASQHTIAPLPLFVFDCLTSSNTKLWELIDRGVKTPAAAIALQQTAGKGQWGKSWVSNRGGLYLSVALDLDLKLNDNSHLVMATAWGIATTLRFYQLPVTIKWSNDLILDRRKLGGIKIETRNLQHKIVKAVVGVGINWSNPVPQVGINLKSYQQQHGQKSDSLEELAAIASYGIFLGYQYYLVVGIEQLLSDYLAILGSLGQQVIVDNCPGEVTGVTTQGKLKVRLHRHSQDTQTNTETEITLDPGRVSLGYIF